MFTGTFVSPSSLGDGS